MINREDMLELTRRMTPAHTLTGSPVHIMMQKDI